MLSHPKFGYEQQIPNKMLARLKQTRRLELSAYLVVASIICLLLSLFRVGYTESRMFFFLNWNLFLAFIPWALSSGLMLYPRLQHKKRFMALTLGVWLLFFPNAPYILTDLFHLQLELTMPVWFDLVLILSFAWVGLMFGLKSLWDIEYLMQFWVKPKWIPVVSMLLLFLGSFGIYLGRFLRWNSWDIIQQPVALLYDVGDRFINPFAHPRTWAVTLLMWVFLSMVYWFFRLLRKT